MLKFRRDFHSVKFIHCIQQVGTYELFKEITTWAYELLWRLLLPARTNHSLGIDDG
jgi:hypothetical protein